VEPANNKVPGGEELPLLVRETFVKNSGVRNVKNPSYNSIFNGYLSCAVSSFGGFTIPGQLP